MTSSESLSTLKAAAAKAGNRFELWQQVIDEVPARTCVEVGVFRGNFAAAMLRHCHGIERYIMVDPWKHLNDWNKPANTSDAAFSTIYDEAMNATEFASDKRVVLRGKTVEVANQIPDASIDFAYIDGDHTLRGITVDLLKIWPKMAPGAILAGDDFCPSVWQHTHQYEPTLVFPYAVYFAEAMGATIVGLPFHQFAISVPLHSPNTHQFIDLSGGNYRTLGLREALRKARRHKLWTWINAMGRR